MRRSSFSAGSLLWRDTFADDAAVPERRFDGHAANQKAARLQARTNWAARLLARPLAVDGDKTAALFARVVAEQNPADAREDQSQAAIGERLDLGLRSFP